MGKPNWLKIKNEYLSTNISQRELAKKYGISFNSLKDRANKEKWYVLKKKQHNKITTKTQQKTEDFLIQSEIERLKKLHYATDLMLERLLEAVTQLDTYIVSDKKTIKKTEYKNAKSPNKPTKETTTETEVLNVLSGNIDRSGLRALASAMKDIKDVITTSGSGDGDDNQIATEIINAIVNKTKANSYLEDLENED